MAWKIPFVSGVVPNSTLGDAYITSLGSFTGGRTIENMVINYNQLDWLLEERHIGDELILATTQERKIRLRCDYIDSQGLADAEYYECYYIIEVLDNSNQVLFQSFRTLNLPNRKLRGNRLYFKACYVLYYDDTTGNFIIGILSQVHDSSTGRTSGTYATTLPASTAWPAVFTAMGRFRERTDDPYQPGQYTDKQGGGGDFDSHSDPIQIPALPSISASDVGLITMYSPTSAQLEAFSDYLWSTDFDLEQFKKLFADPMEAIISLSIMPITPAGNLEYAKMGLITTPVQMTKMSTQYYEVDCGEMDITEFYGSALDYSPMTKFQIYLPYCGIHQLSADDITKKKLRVTYHIDALTGDCVCFLKVGDSVLYTFTGNVATQVPVSSTNASTIFLSTAMRTAPSMASGINGSSMSSMSGTFGQGVMDVMTTKPSVNRSGGISGAIGLMSVQRPYLIKEIPRQNMASDAYKIMGYPSNISGKLSEFKGYTVVDDIHIEGINATKQEIDEIYSILRGGYINAITALQ